PPIVLFLWRVPSLTSLSGGLLDGGEQPGERGPPVRAPAEVVQVAARRQPERPPAGAEVLAEAGGGGPAGVVRVQDAVDGLGAREEGQALGRERGAARAAGRQPPGAGGQVVEHALAQERLASTGGVLESED